MEIIGPDLLLIKERFSPLSDRIEELYNSDPDFRTLCADYFLCIKMLQKLLPEFCEKKDDIREYEDTRNELEKEITDFLSRD